VINITNLYKNFGDLEVLKNISTEIKKGEIISIIGPSGSGKSTFLRCINKLEEPSSGHIYIDGMDLMDKNTDINKVRERVGMVFQHFNLFPNMTVLDNLTLSPIMVKKESKEEAGITVKNLTHCLSVWDSPGGTVERLHLFVGKVDSSQAKGIHGLADENEDIRVHVVKREQAYQWMCEGKIDNGIAVIGLQWLQLNYAQLQKRWLRN